MADKVVSLEFNVNTSDAVTEINKVTRAIEGVTGASNQYEKQLEDIKKATENAGFKELNRALKQYQDLALQAGENSPIGRQALKEAGELKDRLTDLKAAIRTTGQDGLALQASLQLGGGIVAGFGAVQGVMALVGSESEDLQRTLVKLQAAQAALVSIEEIRSVLEKESALRITAVTIAEKARAAATAVSTFVTNGATLSLKLFRGALIATGIGAVVFLLYKAADAMGVFGDSTDETNKKLAEQKERQEALNKQVDEQIKKTTELRNKRQGGLVDLKNELEILKAQGATRVELFNAEKKIIEQQLANLEVAKTTRGKLNAEELEEQRKLQVDKYLLNVNFIRETKELNQKNEEERKKLAEDKRKSDQEAWQNEIKLLEEQVLYDLEAEERKKKRDKDLFDKELADLITQEEAKADYLSEKRKKDLEEEIRIRDAKVQIANDLQSTLTSLGNLIINDSAKAVKFNKAMALIQIGIDTATALSKALSVTQSPSPDNIATGGLAGVAKYAGIAAMIFANAAKAKQILASGNAAGTAPTLGGGGGIAPTTPMQTMAPQTPGRVSNLTGGGQTTVKAIVVESDITSTQKRINSIQEIAKL